MKYKEAFDELKNRFKKTEAELLKLRNGHTDSQEECVRLNGKLEGLHIAMEYMNELDGLLDEEHTWCDIVDSAPQENGDYVCIVEYDFDGKHYKKQQMLSYNCMQQRWFGLGRETDVVTYWAKQFPEPNDLRCTGCLWPVRQCHCK